MTPLDYYLRLCPTPDPEEILEPEPKPYFPTQKQSIIPEPQRKMPVTVRTRIQLTLKIKGMNIPGNTANFSVRGENAINILNILQPLKQRFPKAYEPRQIVRVQLTEYKEGCGSYRPEKGGNINLHNTSVETIKQLIFALLDEHGLLKPQNITEANEETTTFFPLEPLETIEKQKTFPQETSETLETLAPPSVG